MPTADDVLPAFEVQVHLEKPDTYLRRKHNLHGTYTAAVNSVNVSARLILS